MNLEQEVEAVAVGYLTLLSLGFIPLLLFSVLRSFVDALGLTKVSMLLMVLVVPLNMFFNYSLIYGQFGFPEMGGAGAGLGTALAYWGLLVVAFIVFRKHPVLKEYDVLNGAELMSKCGRNHLRLGFR